MSFTHTFRRAAITTGAAALALAGTALPASAAPDFVAPSCPGFDVGLTALTSHGNPTHVGPRAIAVAGNGTSILDNETTGKSITFTGAGSFNVAENPDGSLTFTATGRTVVFLFDTDPGGPSTTLYTGDLVSTISADGSFRVLSHSGGAVDVCALLSS